MNRPFMTFSQRLSKHLEDILAQDIVIPLQFQQSHNNKKCPVQCISIIKYCAFPKENQSHYLVNSSILLSSYLFFIFSWVPPVQPTNKFQVQFFITFILNPKEKCIIRAESHRAFPLMEGLELLQQTFRSPSSCFQGTLTPNISIKGRIGGCSRRWESCALITEIFPSAEEFGSSLNYWFCLCHHYFYMSSYKKVRLRGLYPGFRGLHSQAWNLSHWTMKPCYRNMSKTVQSAFSHP